MTLMLLPCATSSNWGVLFCLDSDASRVYLALNLFPEIIVDALHDTLVDSGHAPGYQGPHTAAVAEVQCRASDPWWTNGRRIGVLF